jgi:hypothetical protein
MAEDYTNKYNTKLSQEDETAYQAWLAGMSAKNGRDMSKDTYDYDMRGFYKSGGTQAEDGHFTDEFKKPNHPTFSDESKYHGVDGERGGKWGKDKDGKDTFTPGKTNLKHFKPEELAAYWEAVGNTANGDKLIMPTPDQKMFPNSDMVP